MSRSFSLTSSCRSNSFSRCLLDDLAMFFLRSLFISSSNLECNFSKTLRCSASGSTTICWVPIGTPTSIFARSFVPKKLSSSFTSNFSAAGRSGFNGRLGSVKITCFLSLTCLTSFGIVQSCVGFLSQVQFDTGTSNAFPPISTVKLPTFGPFDRKKVVHPRSLSFPAR